ncbi:hypothetical protein V8E53_000863 [Lactarius tabidus]
MWTAECSSARLIRAPLSRGPTPTSLRWSAKTPAAPNKTISIARTVPHTSAEQGEAKIGGASNSPVSDGTLSPVHIHHPRDRTIPDLRPLPRGYEEDVDENLNIFTNQGPGDESGILKQSSITSIRISFHPPRSTSRECVREREMWMGEAKEAENRHWGKREDRDPYSRARKLCGPSSCEWPEEQGDGGGRESHGDEGKACWPRVSAQK